MAPVVVVAAYDRDPLVITVGGVNAVGCENRVGIPNPAVDTAVHGVVENRGGEKVNRALGLRLIDILALAGAPPIIERRKNRHRGETRRNVIGVRAEGSGGRAVGPSGEIVKA